MYLDYWGFKETPFGNVPSRNLFFPSPQHEEALMRLLYAVEHQKGVAMLTGEVGSGKTTVSKVFMNYIRNERYEVVAITNPALTPVDFIRAILVKFGEKVESESKTVLLNQLENRIADNVEQGIETVIIIDEAHVIEKRSTFEELRMLLNMQSEDRYLITLIIMGQPPLLDKIFALQPLKERIGIKYHLQPLDFNNTLRYLSFRLKSAGSRRGIFTKEAVLALYDYSGGIPLRINSLCDRSLLIGMMRKAKVIDSKIVNNAVEDIK